MLQAQRQLVLSYKRLRGDDAAPGSASAYRITVRLPTGALACLPMRCCCTMASPRLVARPFQAWCCSRLDGQGWLGVSASVPPLSLKLPLVVRPPCPCALCPSLQVRQLEALVRLSEALARLHLCEEVGRDHVKEVRRTPC